MQRLIADNVLCHSMIEERNMLWKVWSIVYLFAYMYPRPDDIKEVDPTSYQIIRVIYDLHRIGAVILCIRTRSKRASSTDGGMNVCEKK